MNLHKEIVVIINELRVFTNPTKFKETTDQHTITYLNIPASFSP